MQIVDFKTKTQVAALCLAILLSAGCARVKVAEPSQLSGETAAIVSKFVQVSQSHEDALRGASMQVDIDASIPELKKHGQLTALRKISKVGTITYKFLGFQGDNSVKSDVIARYLQAEQQGQGDQSIAITPDNYRFRFRGDQTTKHGQVYVFQLTPRQKKLGLWKGELWIDQKTYLPIVEKGTLVKNPSAWFKKVDFERDFSIRDGVAVPEAMSSTIDVRLIGSVQLNIKYSDFNKDGAGDDTSSAATVAWALAHTRAVRAR